MKYPTGEQIAKAFILETIGIIMIAIGVFILSLNITVVNSLIYRLIGFLFSSLLFVGGALIHHKAHADIDYEEEEESNAQ